MFNQKACPVPNQKFWCGGQAQIILVVMVVLVIIGIYFGFRFFTKSGGNGIGEEKIVENPDDTASPLRSNLLPFGTLSLDTKDLKLSLTTNESSYCRYSLKADQSYITMSKGFSADENRTSHSAKVSNLQNGKTYKYYVRCKDLAGNVNTDDALVEFSIGSTGAAGPDFPAAPAEAPPLRSNLYPSGTLSAGTTKTTISLNTNEPAYCRYSASADLPYDEMGKGLSASSNRLQHTATVSGLTDNRIYEYYVRCRDSNGNKNNDGVVIRFGVGGTALSPTDSGDDVNPPDRFNPSPTKDLPTGTFKTTISLNTSERAICRYSTNSGIGYDSMSDDFDSSDSTSHSTEVTGLNEGQSYKYYVKCIDKVGNKNITDFIISFKVEAAEDNTPPIMRYPSHAGDILISITTQVVISISTNEPANCRYSTEQGVAYSSMKYRFTYYDQTKLFHVATVKNLKSGQAYDFFARCQDLAGNADTGDILISFRIAQ